MCFFGASIRDRSTSPQATAMEGIIFDDVPGFLNVFSCFSQVFDGNSSHGNCVTGPVIRTESVAPLRDYVLDSVFVTRPFFNAL